MLKKVSEATGRAWKFDNKYIWAIIFLVGNALGYAVPESIEGYIPFANKADIASIDSRLDALENKVFDNWTPSDTVIEPEPEVTPEPNTPPKKTKINVEGY